MGGGGGELGVVLIDVFNIAAAAATTMHSYTTFGKCVVDFLRRDVVDAASAARECRKAQASVNPADRFVEALTTLFADWFVWEARPTLVVVHYSKLSPASRRRRSNVQGRVQSGFAALCIAYTRSEGFYFKQFNKNIIFEEYTEHFLLY